MAAPGMPAPAPAPRALDPDRVEDPWSDLPPYLQQAPGAHEWAPPTAWLLGSQIFGLIKKLVLKTLHRGFDQRDWMVGEVQHLSADGATEYWIDYVADSGDAPRLVYHLATLLQQRRLVLDGTTLPRGSVLVVGGDTAYPVADHTSIEERFRAPFHWARKALGNRADPTVVPVFGLPGNHDYYDMLGGFNRQFRAPCARATTTGERPPQLRLESYRRPQQASYFALDLPYDWQFWGLDAEEGIDARQLQFFHDVKAAQPVRNLIVATSRPVMVDRREVAPSDTIRAAQDALGVYVGQQPPPGDQLRLDLSGDVHLYQRYYGPTAAAAPEPVRHASVVSGLGGAFHHPSQVQLGMPRERIQPRAVWPSVERSIQEIGERLIKPMSVFRAGSVWVVGAALGAVFFLLANVDGLNVLHLPQLLAHGDPRAAAIGSDLGRTAVFLAAWLMWAVAIYGAVRWNRVVRRWMREKPDGWFHRLLSVPPVLRTLNWLGINRRVTRFVVYVGWAWALVIAGLVGLIAGAAACPWFHLDGGRAAANLPTVIALVGFAGFGLYGGWKLWPSRRPLMVVGGLLHGVMQVWTPLLWAGFVIADPGVALPLVVVLGVAAQVMGWVFAPRAWLRILVTVACTFLVGCAIVLPLVLTHAAPIELHWSKPLVAGVLGAFFCCWWLGWYIAVSVQFQAHANEAGCVARVDTFAEFLRIRLTPDAATVWAIGITDRDPKPRIQIIDTFTISRTPGTRG